MSNPPKAIIDAVAAVQKSSDLFRNLQKCSDSEARKTNETNPMPPAASHRDLNPRQCAAARALALGDRASAVAMSLNVTPQTISRWRRMPAFSAELRRLHELLAVRASAAPPASSPSAAPVRRVAAPLRKRERFRFPDNPDLEDFMNKAIGRT
jgi:hypothetical protein